MYVYNQVQLTNILIITIMSCVVGRFVDVAAVRSENMSTVGWVDVLTRRLVDVSAGR